MKTVYLLLIATLFFSACNSAKTDIVDLKNETYQVIELLNENVIESNMTLTFNTETGKIAGNSGCNTYFGSYTYQDNDLLFKNVGSTKKYCADKDVNRKEKMFLSSLSEIAKADTKTTNEILLKNTNDQVLIILKLK